MLNPSTNSNNVVFQSNLSCVLNDPKKSRSEISTFFTKTWGNSFIDRPVEPLARLGDLNLSDFENYFISLRQSEKYGRPRLVGQSSTINPTEKMHSLINIPQIFLSSQFSLNDPMTFDFVYPSLIKEEKTKINGVEQEKCRTRSTSSEKSENSTRRSSSSTVNTTINSTKHSSISSLSRLLQDKYSHYLDEIELLISRALSSKSDCFHDAVRSHDEIQIFLSKTRDAISSLRSQLKIYDDESLVKLIHLFRTIRQRQNQSRLLKKFESLSIVKQTYGQVRTLLATSDYLSALDLIDGSREIISSQLGDVVLSKFYKSQIDDLDSLTINLMKEEFQQSLIDQLNKHFETGKSNELIEDERLSTTLIALVAVRNEKYVDLVRHHFKQFLIERIEISLREVQSEKINRNPSANGDSASTFNVFFRSTRSLLRTAELGLQSIDQIDSVLKEILSRNNHKQEKLDENEKTFDDLIDQLDDRLVSIFNHDFNRFQLDFDRLTIDEYSKIVSSIDEFLRSQQNIFSGRKSNSSRPMKIYLQGQISKFVNSFHNQRKQRLVNYLENELWKQAQIPRSIQNSIDELFDSKSSSADDELLSVANETFVLSSSSLHLFTSILDYCSCGQLLPSSSINDIEHRLIELLNIFNSKTCQLVLGAGAVKLGKIRTISAKILALTCRSLQFVKVLLPKVRSNFDSFKNKSESNMKISSLSSSKQFEQLSKLYSEHIDEIHSKLITIIETTFEETLSTYEVRAPMPSDCFRTLITRHVAAFYNAVAKIVSPSDLVLLFTRLNSIFKRMLAKRLRQLKIANDGGPQHGLLTSDLLYYIKQVQSLPGLEMLELHIDEIWTS